MTNDKQKAAEEYAKIIQPLEHNNAISIAEYKAVIFGADWAIEKMSEKVELWQSKYLEANSKCERYEKILNGYKAWGTDGCKSCETGRITLFAWNTECITCDPKGYEALQKDG